MTESVPNFQKRCARNLTELCRKVCLDEGPDLFINRKNRNKFFYIAIFKKIIKIKSLPNPGIHCRAIQK